jgi:hypothetical protein
MGQIETNHAQELAIEIPALPRPALRGFRRDNRWIKSIARDNSPEGKVTLIVRSPLESGEKRIDGMEYERRLAMWPDPLLGFQHYCWILRHQMKFPSLMILLGKIYIDFPGIVVLDGNGDRRIPCCLQSGTRWSGDWNYVEAGCNHEALIAVAREG